MTATQSYVATSPNPREIEHRVRSHMQLVRKIAWQIHGRVRDVFEIDDLVQIGMVALAFFTSPNGLLQIGNQDWLATEISGGARFGNPGEGRLGNLLTGSLEQSNVDIAEEMVGLISAQRYFQANAKAIDTATQISQTIINLRT